MDTTSSESVLSVADAANAIESMLPDEGQQQEVEREPVEGQPEAEAEEVAEQSEDDSEESDEQDEQQEDEQEPKPQTYKVKVDGQEVEVTLDELQAGYSRTKDYTRKTQELAEGRKVFESEVQAVAAERQQYQTLLSQLASQVQAQMGQEPNWEALRASDPIEYSIQMADWQRKTQQMQAVQQEQMRVSQLQQAEQQRAMAQRLERERQALEAAVPEWKDSAKAKADKALILEQGKKLGFSDEELSQAYDHRAILALRKAALYDEMVAKAKAVKPAPTRSVIQPGSGAKPPHGSKRAIQSLKASGQVRDAAKAIELLMG